MRRPLAAAAVAAALVAASALGVGARQPDGAADDDRADLSFRHLSVEQGLRTEFVTAVAQDALGFIWVGTSDGLFRWDGVTLREFRRQSTDSTSLGSNSVQVLAPAAGGDLWVGTDGGLSRYVAATESFRRVRGLPAEAVVALAADSTGGAWAGTVGGGLAHVDRGGAVTEAARHRPGARGGLPHDVVEALYLASDGTLWAGTGDGLARRDGPGRFTTFRPDSTARFQTVSAIRPSERGTLFVGTFGTGLFSVDPASGRFTKLDLGPGDIGVSVISSVYEDADGTVWVGTLGGGLRRLTPGVAEPTVYEAADDDPGSLASDDVSHIMEDRQGILWVATYNGLDRFDRARGTAVRLRSDPTDPTSLADNTVRSVLVGSDGTLYVGTSETLDWSADGRQFRHARAETSGRASHPVRALYEDREGTVWVGTEGGGLRQFAGGALRPVALPDEREGEVSVSSLLEDRAGRFWVGTLDRGLALYDRDRGQAVFYADGPGGLASAQVLALAEDADGSVWAGTSAGLCRVDRAGDRGAFTCLGRGASSALGGLRIQALHARPSGALWVGTDGGLFRVDTRDLDAELVAYDPSMSDLPGDVVRAIVEDESGFLWLSTNGGLTRFEPVVGTFSRRLEAPDGVQRALGVGTRAPDGRLLFGGSSGLLAFYPQQFVARNANPPEVVITGVDVAGQPAMPGDGLLDAAAPVAETVELRADQDYLTFQFAALHFSDPAQNTFRVRLDGFDENDAWREIGRTRSATFNTLSPGSYTFEVQAANADGVWSERGAQIGVVVHPPWWRTWWAILGFAVVGLYALVRVDRWNRTRLLQEERARADRRETELRAETAEAEQRKAQAEASALLAENERKAAELERVREVSEANAKLAAANERLEASLRDLQSTQAQLVQSEKLASLGQLTAGIAHEIKNPLNFVNNFADLSVDLAQEVAEELAEAADRPVSEVLDEIGPLLEDLKDNARRIHEHGQRADRIVRSMLLHSRGGSSERGRVDLNRFVEEYANLAYHGARANDSEFQVALVRDFDEAAGEVEVVPQEFGRVLINLLANAFHAVAQRDRTAAEGYEPAVVVRTRRAGDELTVQVADNGTGIPEDVRQRIFEPFFTTKPTGEGTGLGLSLTHDIVTQVHGGRLGVESTEGEGTTFTIILPARGPAPETDGQHPAGA